MRQQRVITNRNNQTPPMIIDQRQSKDGQIANNQPVRTVLYVEVGDAESARVQLLIQEVNKMYDNARGGVHYVVPVRNGVIKSDMAFEKEFMEVVNYMCEIKDSQIVLKNGVEMTVIRKKI